jgi:hypothetical protein
MVTRQIDVNLIQKDKKVLTLKWNDGIMHVEASNNAQGGDNFNSHLILDSVEYMGPKRKYVMLPNIQVLEVG